MFNCGWPTVADQARNHFRNDIMRITFRMKRYARCLTIECSCLGSVSAFRLWLVTFVLTRHTAFLDSTARLTEHTLRDDDQR